MAIRRLLGEPLVHFLALGAALFAGIAFAGGLERPVVRIEAAEIEQIAAYWELQSQRPPNRDELAALIQERVDEELLSREAVRLGLDQNDMIVRRRLAQKMAFASEDVAAIPEPTDADLDAWYAKNKARYATPGRVAMRHIFFNQDRTGETPQAAARAALAELEAGKTAVGDPSLLPQTYADITDADLARDYGPEFAAAVRTAPVGRWVGPVVSAFGVHVIRVEARRAPEQPPLAEVRDDLRAGWLAERRQEKNREFRASLRKRYKVEIAGLPE